MTVTRTCVGCRKRDTVDRLVRVVRAPDGLRADRSRTAPGRGAYVHPDGVCLGNAVTRKALSRALRVPADLPVIGILELDEASTAGNDITTTAKSGVGMTITKEAQR